mgnify:CR=1 FL=1
MAAYEALLVFNPQLEEEALENVITKFEEVVKAGAGEITKSDRWGKRRLAYEINGCNEGFYHLMEINGSGSTISELDRVLRISDDVIRHLIVKANT